MISVELEGFGRTLLFNFLSVSFFYHFQVWYMGWDVKEAKKVLSEHSSDINEFLDMENYP